MLKAILDYLKSYGRQSTECCCLDAPATVPAAGAPTTEPSTEPTIPETDWNAALTAAARLVKNRDVHGYVPDYGCYACFDQIEKAILALKR